MEMKLMKKPKPPAAAQELNIHIGLVGLGLMGQGIATCLLAYGFRVTAWSRTPGRAEESIRHISDSLREMVDRKVVQSGQIEDWRQRYRFVPALEGLEACEFIIETVKEELDLKREIYAALENVVAADAVVASNTSSIPITVLQQGRRHPDRFIGMHWGEPVQVMRYLEIIPGRQTAARAVRMAKEIGHGCRKEPTVLNVDIRGFLSNRMMYAMIREAFNLVESGIASLEDVDRSFRNDIGWWATIAGPFRWMDLTGIPAYEAVMQDLLPELDNSTEVPGLMRKTVESGAQGIANQNGFYRYDEEEAEEWAQAWVDFTYDLRNLVEKYEKRVKL
jgi:3-hydroxybutyryl-CoA dehydrogenase